MLNIRLTMLLFYQIAFRFSAYSYYMSSTEKIDQKGCVLVAIDKKKFQPFHNILVYTEKQVTKERLYFDRLDEPLLQFTVRRSHLITLTFHF